MTLEDLRAHILGDQALVALANAGNDAGIADALNAPTVEQGLYVPRAVFEEFFLTTGIVAKCDILAAAADTPLPVRVLCRSVSRLVDSKEFPELKLDKAGTVAVRQGLLAAGIITQVEDDALVALGTVRYTSIARSQWGQAVTVDDVSACLDGHRTIGGN